ncbi:unnamed protein product, partial [Rotaria magnacalcarata]
MHEISKKLEGSFDKLLHFMLKL